MKERIYTIPINEAFDQDSECPLCICERKLENDALEYAVGPAMMEPDSRMETNKKGFCTRHYEGMFNIQQNKLPLALVIDTHIQEQIKELRDIYKSFEGRINKEIGKGLLDRAIDTVKGKKSETGKAIEKITGKLAELKDTCAVCDRINNNMDRLLENTLYLYSKESEFKKKFVGSKGFCLNHFTALLSKSEKVIPYAQQAEFLKVIVSIELEALQRIQEDVHHFTEMFDYRNANADWKNSRDAVPRSIEKLTGLTNING